MKKRLLIGKIIGFLGICLFAMGISYIVTYYLEKANFQNINLLVTFEDNKTFKLEELKNLNKEEALLTYPYIFEVQNKNNKASYTITINDIEATNIERSDLNYILIEDEKEVKSGVLSELEENILYQANILKNSKKVYKLYIYLNKEITDVAYEYEIKINSNK